MSTEFVHIPAELFAPAESSHFEGELSLPVLKAGPDLYSFSQPLSWNAEITNTGDAFLVTGTVEGDGVTSCARCLEDVSCHFIGEVEGYFLLEPQGEEELSEEDEEFDVLPDDHTIDMGALCIAALLMEVPLVPLCDEDCKGLCSSCGANLNEGPCDCTHEDIEEFDELKNPFSVLKNLKLSEEAQE